MELRTLHVLGKCCMDKLNFQPTDLMLEGGSYGNQWECSLQREQRVQRP
jgi:hypothetical protein